VAVGATLSRGVESLYTNATGGAAGGGGEGSVVHAYGVGPAGYQVSWGLAQEVAKLVGEHAAKYTN